MRAARPPGARAARRRAAGPVDHPARWRSGSASTGTTRHPREVFDEMRQAMPSIAGITWERLEARERRSPTRASTEDDPGQPVVFTDDFPTPSGRGKLVPADVIPADERPDAEYPFVLITGRQLEHWHTGSMTRRAAVLDAIEPEPVASIAPARPRRARRRARATRSRVDVAPRQIALVRARRRRHAARRACSSRSATTRRRPTC